MMGLRQPVVAAVHGAVAGGGLSLALAADLVITADNTKFTMGYSKLGLSADGSGSWSLPRLIGLRRALELALLSDVYGAEGALRFGLVNRIVPMTSLFDEADVLVRWLALAPTVALGQEADGGTLFLDEIGDMPVALQAVLLRLLDDWTVRPVGGVRAKVDVFLVSATNASLDKAIAEGRFRSDLLYRLNTLEVTLPRLRDRSDFEAVVHHLLGAIDPNYEIPSATIAHLAAHPWPGNIRELRNMLARFTLANADGFIDEAGLDATICRAALTTPGSLHDIQRARILAIYAETAGNINETARRLGVSRNTIYRALGQKKPR